MEEIFAIADRITEIINSYLLLPALASIFCMFERVQKEKLDAGEKCLEEHYVFRLPTKNWEITWLCFVGRNTKGLPIVEEDIMRTSNLEAHSKSVFSSFFLSECYWLYYQGLWWCLNLLNTSNAFLKESNKKIGAELYRGYMWYKEVQGNLEIPSWSFTLGLQKLKND